jgi:hypothetical protein
MNALFPMCKADMNPPRNLHRTRARRTKLAEPPSSLNNRLTEATSWTKQTGDAGSLNRRGRFVAIGTLLFAV